MGFVEDIERELKELDRLGVTGGYAQAIREDLKKAKQAYHDGQKTYLEAGKAVMLAERQVASHKQNIRTLESQIKGLDKEIKVATKTGDRRLSTLQTQRGKLQERLSAARSKLKAAEGQVKQGKKNRDSVNPNLQLVGTLQNIKQRKQKLIEQVNLAKRAKDKLTGTKYL